MLASVGRGDWILCQITSNRYGDSQAIELNDANLATGSLRVTSYVRPGKLFTANRSLIVRRIGILNEEHFKRIVDAIINILRADVAL